jgi:hypothetical protein
MKRCTHILAGIWWLAAIAAIPVRANSISVYISPATMQYSEVSGVTVSNFDNMTVGNRTSAYVSLIGTYAASASSPFDVIAADQYGGATDPTNPTTPTRYFDIGAQSGTSAPVTVTLNQQADYFGFWLSAVDANNGLSFYQGNYLIARFTMDMLTTLFNGGVGNITALNGTKYATSSYYGNPNSGLNAGEPYVFVDFVANGFTFNKVVFDNSGSIASGFESDNHSILATTPTISGDHVYVGGLTEDVPEPPAVLLLAGGLMLIAAARWRWFVAPRSR